MKNIRSAVLSITVLALATVTGCTTTVQKPATADSTAVTSVTQHDVEFADRGYTITVPSDWKRLGYAYDADESQGNRRTVQFRTAADAPVMVDFYPLASVDFVSACSRRAIEDLIGVRKLSDSACLVNRGQGRVAFINQLASPSESITVVMTAELPEAQDVAQVGERVLVARNHVTNSVERY